MFGSAVASLHSLAETRALYDKCIKKKKIYIYIYIYIYICLFIYLFISYDRRLRSRYGAVHIIAFSRILNRVSLWPVCLGFVILLSCWRCCLRSRSASTPSKATLFGVSRFFGWSLYLASTWDWQSCPFVISFILSANHLPRLLHWCKQLKLEWAFNVPLYRVTKAEAVVSLARLPDEGPLSPQTTAVAQSPEHPSCLIAYLEIRLPNA